MTKKLRIAVIGAGSPLFTPDLMDTLLLKKELYGSEIYLMDIDSGRLDFMFRYCSRLMAENDCAFSLVSGTDLDEALYDADFVIVTVAVGGLAMRKFDVEVPLKYGIVHIKADTAGPAGIFRGMRSIPFFVDMGKRMEKLCPQAVLINLSNPLTTITRAVSKETGIKCIGVCSSIDGMKRDIAGKLGVDAEHLVLYSTGVNHFTWMTGIYLDGRDIMKDFVEKAIPLFEEGLPVTNELYKTYGCFPIPGYKYASEFFPYFLRPETGYGKDYGFSADSHEARSKAAEGQYAGLKLRLESGKLKGAGDNPDTGIIAGVMESIALNKPEIYNLNTPNHGQLPSLPYGAVVEGPVCVAGDAIMPLCSSKLPERVLKLLERAAYEQELVVEAAVKGDRELVLEAFLMDPLVNSPISARKIIDELLELQKDYLPQFHK